MTAWKTAIIMLAGPIKHWWDANWGTPEHKRYLAWREAVNDALIAAGYLVYRPHHAFKGRWDERAQSVNDTALRIADIVINLTPPGIPSEGTDGEVLHARDSGTLIVPAPPTPDLTEGVSQLLQRLEALSLQRQAVMQAKVIESIAISPDRHWFTTAVMTALLQEFPGHILRLHYDNSHGRHEVTDTLALNLDALAASARHLMVQLSDQRWIKLELDQLRKIEVLG